MSAAWNRIGHGMVTDDWSAAVVAVIVHCLQNDPELDHAQNQPFTFSFIALNCSQIDDNLINYNQCPLDPCWHHSRHKSGHFAQRSVLADFKNNPGNITTQ